jgi:hypothetical protein
MRQRPSTPPPFRSDATHTEDIGTSRTLNMQIRRLAGMLPGGLHHEYGFSCECGCGETVRRSAAEFDREGGMWLDSHSPEEPG